MGRNDRISNRYQSTRLTRDQSLDPSSVSQLPNKSSHDYERLQPSSRLLEQQRETEGGAIFPPPPKPFVKPTLAADCYEPEKSSDTSNDMLGPNTLMSSDEDLRAIEVQLEELLELESPEPGRELTARPESPMSLPPYPGKIT